MILILTVLNNWTIFLYSYLKVMICPLKVNLGIIDQTQHQCG